MVSVILVSSYQADVHFSAEFGFHELFNAVKRWCDIMIDR